MRRGRGPQSLLARVCGDTEGARGGQQAPPPVCGGDGKPQSEGPGWAALWGAPGLGVLGTPAGPPAVGGAELRGGGTVVLGFLLEFLSSFPFCF